MAKKIAAALVFVALASAAWFIIDDGPDDDDAVHLPSPRPGDRVIDRSDPSPKSKDAIIDDAPIGTARYREAPRGGSGSKAAAAPRKASLIGRVIDEQQFPVAGASVRMTLSREDSRDGTESREERDDLDVLTDADGRFTFTHVPVGFEARLRARRADLCDANIEANIDRARTIDVGEMVAHGGGSVAGRVTAPDDVRVSTAKVMAWKIPDGGVRPGMLVFSRPDPRGARTVTAAADGTFRIDGLDSGEWTLAADLTGFPRTIRKPTTITKGQVTWDADIGIIDGGRILGQVLDGGGRVVNGAKVRFRQDDGSIAKLIDQSATATTTTGTDGRFSLRGLSPDRGLLRVMLDGHRTAEVDQVTPGGDALLIRLQPAAMIHGIVLAPDGNAPVAFEAVPAVKTRFGTQSRGRMEVVYGDDAARTVGVESEPGLFAITQVPDLDVVLLIRSSGFSDEVAGPFRVAAGAREGLSIHLKTEKIVAGIVRDPAGHPVHGARVRARTPDSAAASAPPGERRVERRVVRRRGGPEGAPEPEVPSLDDQPEAITGPDGRFEMRTLVHRPWELVASHGDHADSQPCPIDLAATGPFNVDLTLRESGGVEGVVLATDGAPKPGARVAVSELAEDGSTTGIPVNILSDDEGRFRRLGLIPGSYRARILDPREQGRVMVIVTERSNDDPSSVRFTIEPGRVASITIREPEMSAITGVVRANGTPVKDTRVGLKPQGAPPFSSPTVISTDARGAFSFVDLIPGNYVLSAHGPGSARPVERKVTIGARTPAHELIDLPSGGIEGRVLDQDGEPVAGMTIKVVPTSEDSGDRPRSHGIMIMMTDNGDGPTATVRTVGDDSSVEPVMTNPDGRFVVHFLKADSYNVAVSGGGWIPAKVTAVDVKDDLVTKHIDMQTSKGGTIVATGTTGDGPPLAIVGNLHRKGEEEGPPLATEAGVGSKPLRFTGLAPGRYVVKMSVPGPPTADTLEGAVEVEVRAGVQTPVTVRLGRAR